MCSTRCYCQRINHHITFGIHRHIKALVARIRINVNVGTHKKWRTKYANSFVGSELVSWLVDSRAVPTRRDAVEMSRRIYESRLIVHVKNNELFKDEKELYHLIDPTAQHQMIPVELSSMSALSALSLISFHNAHSQKLLKLQSLTSLLLTDPLMIRTNAKCREQESTFKVTDCRRTIIIAIYANPCSPKAFFFLKYRVQSASRNMASMNVMLFPPPKSMAVPVLITIILRNNTDIPINCLK